MKKDSSQGGGVRTPCTLPLDPPLILQILGSVEGILGKAGTFYLVSKLLQ